MFQFAKLPKHGKSMVRAFAAQRIIAMWQLFLLLLLTYLQSLQKLSFYKNHHHHGHHHNLIQARVDE